MRYLFLFLALLLGVAPATAQKSSIVTRPDSLAAAHAATDTAAAIHRLFAGRRTRRNIIAGSLGAGVLIGAIISGSSESDGGGGHGSSGYGSLGGGGLSFDGADYLLLYAIPAVPLILLDYVIYANYSRKREVWILEEFQAHRLPKHLKRKLKRKYFVTAPKQ